MYFNLKTFLLISMLGFASVRAHSQVNENETEELQPGVTVTYYDIDGEVYDMVDEPARFPGGIAALVTFLSANISYPYNAVQNKIEGTCYIQFVVTKKGNISKVEVKKGVPNCRECDQEAVRVIKSMPSWEPGTLDGKRVNSTFSLPISFKL